MVKIPENKISRATSASLPVSSVFLNEREDAATIKKTQTLPLPGPQFTDASLVDRVTQSPTLAEQLEEIEPEHFAAVETALTENPSPELNYINQVVTLVALILAQLNRIAEKDRVQIDGIKANYQKATQESADLIRALGSHGLKFSALTMACALLPYLSPHASDREIGGIFVREVCPKLGELFGGSLMQSDMKKADALASLLISEYSAKTQKSGAEANNRQELTAILQQTLTGLKEAARAG